MASLSEALPVYPQGVWDYDLLFYMAAISLLEKLSFPPHF